MDHLIKYLRHPTFTEADWIARNPLLKAGEVGYVLENNKVVNYKVGPGYWNNLSYISGDYYPYSEAPTNPIGDASGSLLGLSNAEIIHKMLNPYQAPAFSAVQNNANGTFQAISTREIGNALSGNITFTYTLSNLDKLVGATPLTITAGGIFSNEGLFPVGPSILTLALALNPGVITTYVVNILATHQKGTVSGSTQIRFWPKIMWLSSPQATLTALQFMALSKSSRLTNNYKADYAFAGNGYSWIAIPSMLNPSNLLLTDVTNPNAPAGYTFEAMGTLSINNGVATYNYQMFRSSFNQIKATTLRIA